MSTLDLLEYISSPYVLNEDMFLYRSKSVAGTNLQYVCLKLAPIHIQPFST